jgi:transcriptional regulator with XRE-family HTH domain
MATVGERLRVLRQGARLSQAELGRRLGIAGPTISNYETGYSRLVADELPKFAQVLGCSPCDFFEQPSAEWEPGEGDEMGRELIEVMQGLSPKRARLLLGMWKLLDELEGE